MRSGKDTALFRLASAAHHWGFTPNMMTTVGLTFGVASGALFAFRAFPFAFTFGFLSVFCDVLDGTLARKFHLESKTGLVLDSVSDRIAEAAVVLGALVAGIIQPIGLLAIAGSVCLFALRGVSYRRGLKTDYVLFGRTERLVFLFAGLLVPLVLLSSACFVIAGGFGIVSSCQIAVSLWHQRRN
jgi:CDP-diacylglycerol---glycerol-3-phosphate 3-phosphatidyltransferase